MAKKLTKHTFIEKANIVHNFKYDYSLVEYIGAHVKIKIICPIHGVFKQTPNNHTHVKKHGCSKCGAMSSIQQKTKPKEQFIEKANIIHNFKYDYSLVNYINDRTKIKIICPKHGMFKQRAGCHLQKQGCPKCAQGKNTSKEQQKLFERLKKTFNNKNILLEKEIITNNTTYFADICFPQEKIIVEYYGDYWHCNPRKYKSDYYHSQKKMYTKDIWKRDKNRKKELEKLGYKVFIIWENKFKANKTDDILNIERKINETIP